MNLTELAKRGISNPLKIRKVLTHQEVRHSISRELNKLYHSHAGRREWNPEGIDIFAEDWDNLIILDACRHDAMQEAVSRNGLNWKVGSRTSRGSQTPEWLYANFRDRQLHDTVYVTATTMPHYLGVQEPDTPRQQEYGFDLDVHDLINVWANPPESAIETYVDRAETELVLPAESMIEPAVKAAKDYPNKRIIVHIVQPHDPYWGETGNKLHKQSASPWHDKLNGDLDVPIERLRKAYRENVDIAVDAANKIVSRLPGKTVVSSDHGEYLYEKSGPIPTIDILHPDKTYTDTLVKVPWIEISNGSRRKIISETPRFERQGPDDDETGKTIGSSRICLSEFTKPKRRINKQLNALIKHSKNSQFGQPMSTTTSRSTSTNTGIVEYSLSVFFDQFSHSLGGFPKLHLNKKCILSVCGLHHGTEGTETLR